MLVRQHQPSPAAPASPTRRDGGGQGALLHQITSASSAKLLALGRVSPFEEVVEEGIVRVNGRLVLVGDGVKIAKRGRKMPAVKLLQQQSESNTKPEYIMGHSLQVVSLLVHAAQSFFTVPLAARIHEGLIWSNRDKRTLLDKMLGLLGILAIGTPFYFVADAYYAAGKVVKGLLEQGHHLITLVKSNAVAYLPVEATRQEEERRAQALRQKDKAQVAVFGYSIDGGGREPCLRRAQPLFLAIAFVIYYGVRRDGLSASWPSFTQQEVRAC
jgi:hypothetical protein